MPIQRVPRYVLLLKELVKQIHKVLETGRSDKESKKESQKKVAMIQKSNSRARKQNKQAKQAENFYQNLELEIVSIEKALYSFEAVARQIDSKIDEVSYTCVAEHSSDSVSCCLFFGLLIVFGVL